MTIAFQTSDVCSGEASSVCNWLYKQTNSELVADLGAWAASRLPMILFTLALAYFIVRLIRRQGPRAEKAWLARQSSEAVRLRPDDLTEPQRIAADLHLERTKQRSLTLRVVFTSVLIGVVWFLAGLIALDQIGLNLAPLLAGAGVVGIALGFGAQRMVQDFLAGLFIVIEDQYGVGDVVDIGDAVGTVEQVNLRSTRLRDVSGVVWYVPNGQINRVANMSQLWSKAVLDISVGYETDIDEAAKAMKGAADAMWHAPSENATIIEEPVFLGVERFEADGITLRLVIKTEPNEQWAAARELRLRIKQAFDAAGIDIPFPQRTVRVISE